MEITDVQIRLVRRPTDRLRAFCNVTFDGEFVIRDMKIVDGANGLFVAMPSRKVNAGEGDVDSEGRPRQYRDIAHPITTAFREILQQRVLDAYEDELAAAKAHGSYDYAEGSDEEYDDNSAPPPPVRTPEGRGGPARRPSNAGSGPSRPPGGGDSSGSRRGGGAPQPTEYDELIAGLRGRPAGGEPRRDQETRPPAGVARGRGREGQRDAGRDTGRDASAPRGGREPRGREGGNRRPPASDTPARGGRGPRREEDGRRPRRDEAAPQVPETRRSTPPPPPIEEPIDLREPTPEPMIDAGGFGEGIFEAKPPVTNERLSGPPREGSGPRRSGGPNRSERPSESKPKAAPPPVVEEVRIDQVAEEPTSVDAREDTQAFGAGIL